MAALVGSYAGVVPGEVIQLDHLDFEAKLQGLAGDRERVVVTVSELARTWEGLKGGVAAAGGDVAVAAFDEHVALMRELTAVGSDEEIADEAQNGLDLVDEVEVVYTG